MPSNSTLLDGKWSRGFYAGRGRKSYPFAQNGDYRSILVIREFRQSEANFTPGRRGVDKDPVYADAYLILESEPEPLGMGDAISVTRTYARIPQQQTIPSSIFVNKPAIEGEFPQLIGSFLVFQPDSTVASYDGYLKKTVSSDSGAPGSSYPTGGTYTLTFEGDTTAALDYNDSSTDIQTALNGLTSIADRGNVTVTGTYNSVGGFAITFGNYAAATLDTSSLTLSFGTSTSSTVTLTDGGYTQTVLVACPFTVRITGGTFTITIFGQTTGAIAYNATPAQVATALNALTEVQERGNCTVSAPNDLIGSDFLAAGEPNKLRFTIQFANAAITTTPTLLTPVGSTATAALTDGVGRTQSLTFSSPGATRTLSVSGGHEIATGDTVYVKADGAYYTDITAITVPGTTAVTLTAGATAPYMAASSITEVGKLAVENYTPGVANTPCRRVSTFYLPGVTAGISSADDIPLPDRQSDAAALLQAIFEGDTSINYDVGDLEQWLGSPILVHTITTLNATQI